MMENNRFPAGLTDSDMRSRLLIVQVLAFVFAWTAPANGAASDNEVSRFLESHCIRCHGKEKQKGKLALHEAPFDFAKAETSDLWLKILEQLTAGDMPPPDEEDQPSDLERNAVIEWIDQQLLTAGSGEAYRKKLLAPEYGNWVSHEKLFSGEIDTPPYSPARLWRFSPEIFKSKGFGRARSPFTYVTPETGIRDYATMSQVDQSTVQMILIAAEQFLEEREKKGEFKRFADGQPSLTEQERSDTVRREFRRVIGRDPSPAESAKFLAFLEKNLAAGSGIDGLKTTIKAMFLSPEAIYRMEFGLGETDEHGRRHLSPEELAHALAFALTNQAPDRTKVIQLAYEKGELNTSEDVARVVRQLLEEELSAGESGGRKLPRIMRFFEEFFGFDRAGEVFKDNERKSRENIPQWNTSFLIRDAKLLIGHILKRDRDVIAELLTTDEYFIAHPGDNEYAKEAHDARIAEITAPGYVAAQVAKAKEQLDRHQERSVAEKYSPEEFARRIDIARKNAEKVVLKFKTALDEGINPFPNGARGMGGDLLYIAPYNLPTNNRIEQQRWNWPIEQPLQMPKEQRAGLLTHPAWLAAWSLNDGNDPIHRGIWVRERLLAGVLQDVPPDVDASVPTDPHQTLRERLDVIRAERCWNCHRKINPLGETFEMFDDWGRYRAHHYFNEDGELVTRRDKEFDKLLAVGKLTTREVDASGAITGSGDAEVDGDVRNAVEMLHRLGGSERARQSFIRHLFRYFMGRNEMLSDSKTLIEAEQAYLENGGSFKALVVSLLSSDSFLYRR